MAIPPIGSSSTPSSYGFDVQHALAARGGWPVPDSRSRDAIWRTTRRRARVTSVRVDNTDPGTPRTPTGLTPVSASPTINFTAATDGGSGIAHYDVYRDGTPVGPQVPVGSGGPYTWSDTGLSAAGSYDYTVVAVDAAGNESSTVGGTHQIYPRSERPVHRRQSVTAFANPTSQRPQISWGAPVFFAVDHYFGVPRRPRSSRTPRRRRSPTSRPATARTPTRSSRRTSSNVARYRVGAGHDPVRHRCAHGPGSRPGDCRARRFSRYRLGGRERRGRLRRDALRRPQVAVLDAPGLGGRW